MGLFGKNLQAGLVLLAGCSLLVKTQGPVSCEDGAAPLCEGTTLVLCVDGLESLVSCAEGCAATPEAHCAVCGDGIVEGAEVCEPDGASCGTNCQPIAICGDNILQPGEECDDGGELDGDGCSGVCLIEFCGDGATNNGEDCDPVDPNAPVGCRADCRFQPNGPACGDGVPDAGEVCDDGNIRSGDGCSFDCLFAEGCGNGVLDVNESCELGDDCSSCQESVTCRNNLVDLGELCFLAPSQEADFGTVTASTVVSLPSQLIELAVVASNAGSPSIDVVDTISGSAVSIFSSALPETAVFLSSGDVAGGSVDEQIFAITTSKQIFRISFADGIGFSLANVGGFNALPNTNIIQQVALADVNLDGRAELLVLTKDLGLGLLPNTIGALENDFISISTAIPNAIRMVVADFNNDGKDDVAIASNGDAVTEAEVKIFLSISDATSYAFTPDASISFGINSFSFVGLVANDFDANGSIDLIAASNGNGNATDKLLIIPNNGDAFVPNLPVFSAAGTPLILAGGVGARALTAGDVDLDGGLELVVSSSTSDDVALLKFNGQLSSSDAFSVLARYALRNNTQDIFTTTTTSALSIISVFASGVETILGRQ